VLLLRGTQTRQATCLWHTSSTPHSVQDCLNLPQLQPLQLCPGGLQTAGATAATAAVPEFPPPVAGGQSVRGLGTRIGQMQRSRVQGEVWPWCTTHLPGVPSGTP